MGKRVAWLWPLSLCLGCAAFPAAPPEPAVAPLTEIQLAARDLEKGDEAGALPHLRAYVEAHPEQITIRAHLAELLCKLDHKAEARQQFEQYIRDAQIQGGTSGKHLISAHTRLVELADGDEYAEHLNRGIGLLLLARQLLNRPEKDGTPDPQKLLFQSAAELKEAVERKPDAARPQWYLYETWSELGQQLPARRSLRQAHDRAEFSDLLPGELQALLLAWGDR